MRDAVRAFAQAELWPHAARWDKEHTFPKDVHKGLAALGAYGICVPEEWGGAQMDYLTLAVVLEEIAAGDGGTSTVKCTGNLRANALRCAGDEGDFACEVDGNHGRGFTRCRQTLQAFRPRRIICHARQPVA